MKQLTRSRKNRVIAGVAGGFGEYFEMDPTVIRLIFVLAIIAGGVVPGVVAYLVAIFLMPLEDMSHGTKVHDAEPV